MCVAESMPMQCIQKKQECESNSKKPGGSSKKPQGGKGSNPIAATKVHVKRHKHETGGGSGRKGASGRVKVHALCYPSVIL